MIFELLKLDLDLSLQLPSEISSLVTRMVQHDLKYTGTNVLVLVSKRHDNSLITPANCPPSTTNFNITWQKYQDCSFLLISVKTSMRSQKDTWLAVMEGSKKLNDMKVLTQRSMRLLWFFFFWVLQFRVTWFLNEHRKPEVQHKPFKKEQRWRSYCMNIATQDHLASKTFYCFETVHKVIKNSNGLCQKSIQRRRGKERTEQEQWK